MFSKAMDIEDGLRRDSPLLQMPAWARLRRPRRRKILTVVGAVSVLVFVVLNHRFISDSVPLSDLFSDSSSRLSSCPLSPPQPAYQPSPHDRFNWKTVPIQNPVQTFAQLPTRTSAPLPVIQHDFTQPISKDDEEQRLTRQTAVKAAFERCWRSYRARAWMHDELAPISGGAKDPFGGWGATLVDSLDTLLIMNMTDEYETAISAAMNISFNPHYSSSETINTFETTIRYLGGFLAAYDLTDCRDTRALDKAIEVGDMIYAAFDTPTRMPIAHWNPRKVVAGELQEAAKNGIIAEMASYNLEFTRLSQLTGDMRYYDAISRIADAMDSQQNLTRLPGMWPISVNVAAPDLTTGTAFGLGAMSDSAYEYLPKMYQLVRSSQYHRLYEYAMNTAIERLFFRPSLPDGADVLISGNIHMNSGGSGGSRDTQGQHLTCFAGGMLALGGKLIQNKTHVDIGRKLTDGCVWAYRNSPLGVAPEIWYMDACPSWAECEYKPNESGLPRGFAAISDSRYILRPEAIESVYYLYRITGDRKYQDVAWEMFQAINDQTKTEFANAALKDMAHENPPKDDSMESFWMGETLKYFYLVFSEPDLIGLDDFVFNTEAHAFRISR